jgi:DNA modification methylase
MSHAATNAMQNPDILEQPAAPLGVGLHAVVRPPQPYYNEDGVTIYCGDNRALLPLMPDCDLLLTDPPYGIGADKNLRANKRHGRAATASRDYGHGAWDSSTPDKWVIEMAMSKCRSHIIWGGNYFGMPAAKCWLVWDKENGNNGYADCELAWTNLDMAVRRIKYRWAGMLQENMAEKEVRWHPTQKPAPVMEWCLGHTEATSVLDPWMGSGTTLIAARNRGIKAVGIEINETYCQAAVERLRQRVLVVA